MTTTRATLCPPIMQLHEHIILQRPFLEIVIPLAANAPTNVRFSLHKCNYPFFHANWAGKMLRLPVRFLFIKLPDHIATISLEERVTALVLLEFIFPLNITDKTLDCFAKLNIQHICCCQSLGKIINKGLKLRVASALPRSDQTLDLLNDTYSTASGTSCCRYKPQCRLNLCRINHYRSPNVASEECSTHSVLSKGAGWVQTLHHEVGTGGGSRAQDMPEIMFPVSNE